MDLGEETGRELKEGRVMGPSSKPLIPNLQLLPIELVPIINLSYPSSLGINVFIDPELCSVEY